MIASLYSVSAEVWMRFFNGEPLRTPDLPQFLADLCDAIGGGNIASVDMGDEALVAYPFSHAGLAAPGMPHTCVLKVSTQCHNFIVLNWATIPRKQASWSGRADWCDDDPRHLCDAITEAVNMFEENDSHE